MNVGFLMFPLFWILLGLLFYPLVKDLIKVKNRIVLIVMSMIIGVPVALYYSASKKEEYDSAVNISENIESMDKIYKSIDEYLADCSITLEKFNSQSKKLIEDISGNKNISSIFLEEYDTIIDIINTANIPVGVVPIGIDVNNDIISIDFRKDTPVLVIVDTELDNSLPPYES